jgi:hypothetical protein
MDVEVVSHEDFRALAPTNTSWPGGRAGGSGPGTLHYDKARSRLVIDQRLRAEANRTQRSGGPGMALRTLHVLRAIPTPRASEASSHKRSVASSPSGSLASSQIDTTKT